MFSSKFLTVCFIVSASEIDILPVEGGQQRLQRAMSCDSVSSDSSILEIEPEMPKIGQLEFGLEYDRFVQTTTYHTT